MKSRALFLPRVLNYEQTWLVEGFAPNNKKTVAKSSTQFIEYEVTQSRNPQNNKFKYPNYLYGMIHDRSFNSVCKKTLTERQ